MGDTGSLGDGRGNGMEQLKQAVRSYITENFLFGTDGGLADDASLLDNGVIDSTGVLELVAFLETQFAITVSDEELLPENLDSIAKIAAFLSRKDVGGA
jgi:acyl carrier protein